MGKLPNNRPICVGDRGEKAIRTEFTKREQREAFRASVDAVKVRMRDWTDDFIKKIYHENKVPAWHEAARETMNERKVPRDKAKPTPPPPQPKKHKKRKFGTQAERDARSTAWKLDRELDNKIKNTP